MKALILSTATGGGHNTAAHAVMEALTERGVECRFEDCVAFGGQKLSATVSNVYFKVVHAAPDAFGRLYRFAKAISTPRIKSPVYLFNAAYARKMEQLLTDNDEPPKRRRKHVHDALTIYRGLLQTGVVERLDRPDDQGRLARLTVDLQADFALNQPLSPFALAGVLMFRYARGKLGGGRRLPPQGAEVVEAGHGYLRK